MKQSSRHHYIPKFLIKEFTDSNGLLYMYDKINDEIKSKQRAPKSVFWEKDRNSITTKSKERNSLIEDYFFKELDNHTSDYIKKFQHENIDEILLTDENLAQFDFFLINLFWRLPYTDFASTDLIKRAQIDATGIDPEILRNDPEYHKALRIGLFKHTIEQFDEFSPPADKYHVLLSEFEHDLFVLGDNPVVFEKTPKKFVDLRNLNHIMPITSKRAYIYTIHGYDKMTRQIGHFLNAQIIDQSKRHVVSGNRELLKISVQFYKELKKENLLFFIRDKIFGKL
ncbi:DUF4238 domain-containing protein [Reichenbachiella sp.]|uniref:DUF4238 domain-containing protein n=1 Tax=Reichenbachiella sp. TaxID=2184521 RepID=UPI003296950F